MNKEEEDEYQTRKQQLLPKHDDELPIDPAFRHMTKGMFYEFRHQSTSELTPIFTLKPYDFTDVHGNTYASVYLLYMECDSEYEAAIKILGSYNHWKKLARAGWFSSYLEEWEAERNIRDEAIARSTLIAAAEAGNVTAANSIYKNSKKADSKVGRPTTAKRNKTGGTKGAVDTMLKRISDNKE